MFVSLELHKKYFVLLVCTVYFATTLHSHSFLCLVFFFFLRSNAMLVLEINFLVNISTPNVFMLLFTVVKKIYEMLMEKLQKELNL